MVHYLNQHVKIKQNGFTLIELIIVLIILGVISITVIPKLIGQSAFESYIVRDQLIAHLRLVQLQAMNTEPASISTIDEKNKQCHWLVVKSGCFYTEQTDKSTHICKEPSAVDICKADIYETYNKVLFTAGMLNNGQYRFNLDGTLNNQSTITPIIINGEDRLSVIIESEGYIHGGIQK
jgi:MSHA pilin protein MshC